MRIPLMKQISWYLVVAMLIIGIAPKVDAGIVSSELVASPTADRADDISKIQKVLEMKMVKERLTQFGLNNDEIQKKIEGMDDQQLHQFALQLDEINFGGSGAFEILVLVAAILVLVIIIMHMAHRRTIVTK
jgi:hypothetical protein